MAPLLERVLTPCDIRRIHRHMWKRSFATLLCLSFFGLQLAASGHFHVHNNSSASAKVGLEKSDAVFESALCIVCVHATEKRVLTAYESALPLYRELQELIQNYVAFVLPSGWDPYDSRGPPNYNFLA